MKSQFKKSMLAMSVLSALSFSAYAEDKKDGVSSTVDLSFRYRIETVDQDNFSEDAEASTV
ncbi:MAG: hypothetical protein ABJI60_17850, partial [Kangiellaceae bacterium]